MSYREALTDIYERTGTLSPAQVLDEATDPASDLHGFFEWDDTEAASRYRVIQAAALIRRCRITVQVGAEDIRRVRAFTYVPHDPPTYMPTEEALRPENRDVVMQQALRDLASLRNKYKALVDFSEVVAAWLHEQEAAVG